MTHRRALAGTCLTTLIPVLWLAAQGRTCIGLDLPQIGLPSLEYQRQMLLAGTFWAWNPYTGSGLPTVASSMGTVFYPLNLLWAVWTPTRHILYFWALHGLLAGIGAYLCLAYLRFAPWPCLVGALFYANSPLRLYTAINHEQYAIVALAPWVWLFLERFLARPGPTSGLRLAAVAGFTILGGGFHFLGMFVITLAVYACLRRPTWWLVVAAGLTCGMGALLLVPTIELAGQGVARSVALAYQEATLDSMVVESWPLWMNPLHYGTVASSAQSVRWSAGLYEHVYALGVGVLVILGAGLLGRRRRYRALVRAWGILAVVALLLALGRANPAFPGLYEDLFFLHNFRSPVRLLAPMTLAAMFWVALGTRNLLVWARRPSPAWNLYRLALVGLLGVYLAVVGPGPTGLPSALFWLGLAVTAAVLYRPRPLLVVALLLSSLLGNWVFVQADFFIRPDWVERERAFLQSLGTRLGPLARVLYTPNPESTVPVGLVNLASNSVLTLRAYNEFLFAALNGRFPSLEEYRHLMYMRFHPLLGLLPQDLSKRRNPLYRMLCSSALVTPETVEFETPSYPGLWLSREARVSSDMRATLSRPLDPEAVAWLEVAAPKRIGRRGQPGILDVQPDRVRVGVQGVTGWLTLPSPWYPEWRAYIDGREVTCYRSYSVFRTVWVESGSRQLEFVYRPRSIWLGGTLSLLCLGGWLLSELVDLRRRRHDSA